MLRASLALLLFAGPLAAQQAVIMAPVKVAKGDLVILDGSQSKGTGHVWKLIGSTKSFLQVDGGLRCVFATGTDGVYSFVLAVAEAGKADIAIHTLQVGDGVPVPPIPPPTPTPDDPVVAALKVAYAAESDPAKAAQVAKLAAVYRNGVGHSSHAATWGELFNLMLADAQAAGIAGKLQIVQAVIQKELAKVFTSDRTVPLDAPGRAQAAAGLGRIANLLGAIP